MEISRLSSLIRNDFLALQNRSSRTFLFVCTKKTFYPSPERKEDIPKSQVPCVEAIRNAAKVTNGVIMTRLWNGLIHFIDVSFARLFQFIV